MVKSCVLLSLYGLVIWALAGCSPEADYNSWADKYYISRGGRSTIGLQAPAPTKTQAKAETLDDILNIALKNSPELQNAFYKWQASLASIAATKSLPDPQISYTYFIESVQTRVGAQNQSLMLSQKLPLWTKIGYKTDIAKAMSNAEFAQLTKTRLKLVEEIKTLWAKLYLLDKTIQTNRQILQLLENTREVLKNRYAGSQASKSDLLDIQMRIDLLEDQILTLQEKLDSTRQQINSASGRDINAAVLLPQELPANTAKIDSINFTEDVLTRSPELTRLDAKLAASRTKISSAKAQYIPDLTISGGWVDTESMGGPMSPKDDGLDPVTVGVSINIPVWANRINADIRKAKNESLSIAAQKNTVKLKLQSDATDAIYTYNQAERKIELYQNSLIPKIHESFKIDQSNFAAGRTNYKQLLDTLETYLEFELNYHSAIAELNIATAKLEYLNAGELNPK